MESAKIVLTAEGLETLMARVADRLSSHQAVAPILALNRVTATPSEIRHALCTTEVRMDAGRGITLRPTGAGQPILIRISKLIADAIDEELGTTIMFTMTT